MTVAHRPDPSRSRLLIIAGAGYGKSAFLESLRPEDGRSYRAADVLAEGPPTAPWIGVDDLDELRTSEQAEVLRQVSANPGVALAVAARAPLAPTVRAALRGPIHDRGPAELALTSVAITALLAEEYGVVDAEAAVRVRDLTAGWPTLVQLAGDALSRDPHVDLAGALTAPGSAAVDWLAAQVFPIAPRPILRVLALAAALGPAPVSQPLLDRLAATVGISPSDIAGATDLLRSTGILVPRRRTGVTEELFLVPVVAGALRSQSATPSAPSLDAGPGVLRAAASALENDGAWVWAARAHSRAGDVAAALRMVEEHGATMLRRGDAAQVAALVSDVPPRDRSALVQRTLADALRMSGDLGGSQRAFESLIREADASGWSPALATSVAGLHYLRGDFEQALEIIDRAVLPIPPGALPPSTTHDRGATQGRSEEARDGEGTETVQWLNVRVHVLTMLGRIDEARPLADWALALAEWSGHAEALALGHLAVGKTRSGVRREAHHEEALRFATAAGDAVTAARVRGVQTYQLLVSARYADAVPAAREAVRLAELSSPPGLLAVTLHNLGDALTRVGELAEASVHLRRSFAVCRRLGSARSALGLLGLAHIDRLQGHHERSRAAYLEVVDLAHGSGDRQVLVNALAGLSRVTEVPEDPNQGPAAEAARIAGPDVLPVALTALGWAALARGHREVAREHAVHAVRAAREVCRIDALAEALELLGEACEDLGAARPALMEALAIWHDGGAGPDADRLQVLLGRLAGADCTDRSRAREAARRLQRLGIPRVNGRPVGEVGTTVVAIDVLGTFRVQIDGAEVPLQAWRSRQARTLVKILASRRGRVVTRAQLCELLWPDDDPARTGHRLSVLLATVRGVLDPDKAWPPERYLRSDQIGIWLDLRTVSLDADALIRDAADAVRLLDTDDVERAREILTDVDARYRGDAFEEDPAQEWADGLREEARAAWCTSVRRLATLYAKDGRGTEALGLLVRLLAVDPYDERVHRRLVTSLARSGRHGEARRAFDRWAAAMASIDAPPPDVAVLAA